MLVCCDPPFLARPSALTNTCISIALAHRTTMADSQPHGRPPDHDIPPESSTSPPEMAPQEGLPDPCQDSELTPDGLQGTPHPSNGPGGVLHDFLRTSRDNPTLPHQTGFQQAATDRVGSARTQLDG